MGTAVWATVTGTASASDVGELATAWNRSGGGDSSNNTIASYSIASTPYTAPAGALTINYVADGEAVKDALIPDVSEYQAGDSYSYSFPTYIVKDGTLYKSDKTKYTESIDLGVDETSVDVTYTAQGTGTYQFADFDGTAADDASNGGYKTGIYANGSPATFTVEADGVYSIEGRGYASTSKRTVSLRVGAKDADAIYTSPALSNWGTDFSSSEDVTLHAGDVVYIVGSDSRAFIDYILITKKGDIPVVADPSATVTDTTNVKTFDDGYEGTATAAVVYVTYANANGSAITLSYADRTPAELGTEFTGDGNVVVAAVIANAVDENPIFTAAIN